MAMVEVVYCSGLEILVGLRFNMLLCTYRLKSMLHVYPNRISNPELGILWEFGEAATEKSSLVS